MMGSKLGLAEAKKEDESLVTDLLDWMHETVPTTPIPSVT